VLFQDLPFMHSILQAYYARAERSNIEADKPHISAL